MILYFLILLLLIILFSGAELSFVSSNQLTIKLYKNQESERAQIVNKFFTNSDDFLGTMLLGYYICLVAISFQLTNWIHPLLTDYDFNWPSIIFIDILVLVSVILLITELIPKIVIRILNDSYLHSLAYLLKFFQSILYYPARLIKLISAIIIERIFRIRFEPEQKIFNKLDLEYFMQGTQNLSEEPIDKELFSRALRLKEVRIKDCMIPRSEIQSIDVSCTMDELIEVFDETKLSRILVIEDDIDNVLGYVHHQQLLRNPKSIKKIMFQLPFLPSTMRAQELLNTFIKKKINIGVVVDEFGSTSGLITMEDILEQLFGEIEDEFDQEEYIETKISDDEYIFSGRLELDYLNDKYPLLKIPKSDHQTLSGYLIMTTGNIPSQGELIKLDGNTYQIELVSDKKIEIVRVLKLVQNEKADS